MKDNEKVELTAGDLRRAAEKCGTAKEVLKTLCPEVFREGEWEEIELSQLKLEQGENCVGATLSVQEKPTISYRVNPFSVVLSSLSSGTSGMFKVEFGKLWRRKSQ